MIKALGSCWNWLVGVIQKVNRGLDEFIESSDRALEAERRRSQSQFRPGDPGDWRRDGSYYDDDPM